MKHDLINQGEYLLLVTERGVYEGWAYHPTSNTVYRFGDLITSFERKVIAHLPLNGSPILEGVDLLPPLEDEVDVEKMALEINPVELDEDWDKNKQYRDEWMSGYNKALEDNKDKKYTEEDLRKAMKYASEITNNKMKYMEDYIQSLSQPKIPIGFQCEMEDKIALDGHTIIRTEPITTTTPEGHTQWIGTYIYE